LAATAFAAQFYAAVAAGQSLKAAFDQGLVAIEAVSLKKGKTPQLILADGVTWSSDSKKPFRRTVLFRGTATRLPADSPIFAA
jgi:hypothetical protein